MRAGPRSSATRSRPRTSGQWRRTASGCRASRPRSAPSRVPAWCCENGPMSDEAAAGITPLGDDVFQIDTKMAGYSGITAGYLIRSDRPCLVETGTAPSAPIVRDALAALGVGPKDLSTVVVTHIHLERAGGVGDIAQMFPNAQVVVHTKGARHLADPSRLMASARLVYGDALATLFGALAPPPAERIDT